MRPALDEDRAVSDDPALVVDGQDIAGVVDLEALLRHGERLLRVNYREDGTGWEAAQVLRRPLVSANNLPVRTCERCMRRWADWRTGKALS